MNELAQKPLSWLVERTRRGRDVLQEVGAIARLFARAVRVLFSTRFEPQAFLYQMQQIGVRSLAIAGASSVFVGIVMTIQFAVAMEKWGARDSTLGRVIVISEARELAPALTALVVGSRVAAGMAAEIGSMAVTEQIDAIRALGADPIRKLVVPRILAGAIILPLTTVIAFCLGMTASLFIAVSSYGIAADYFVSTAMDSLLLGDFFSGIAKTPFFGILIALLGCYFGLHTRGGTEGVGQSTTRSVVVVSVTILVADALLTQLFLVF